MKNTLISIALCLSMCSITSAQESSLPELDGKFQPTNESLKQYVYPQWFKDAKFGIWCVWGPMAVPRQGDWYAKNMYVQNDYNKRTKTFTGKPNRAYTYHLEHYGHPSEFGYKDLIPLWKAEHWDPNKLMKLFKEVGAKYFVSIATHHDNFFLWNSKLHNWNSVLMGPKRDVIGEWQKAAKKNKLPFGVSEHLAASYTWFQAAHGTDKTGPKAGVPYDGNNPEYWGLYHEPTLPGDNSWLTNNPKFQMEWYNRIKELIDMYHPDLLYSDSALPFGEIGKNLLAYYYNQNVKQHKHLEAVYNCKEESDGRFVKDVERGVIEGISKYPWQTDTFIGGWIYNENQKCKSFTEIIQMLVDIVSKNGNLLLNVTLSPEGDINKDELEILYQIRDWLKYNGEAIYGSRTWYVFGEGPSINAKKEAGLYGGLNDVQNYKQGDLRFTRKGNTLYAFTLLKPTQDIEIKSIPNNKRIKEIKLLGSKEKIKWNKNMEGLLINLPLNLPDYNVLVFKISLQ